MSSFWSGWIIVLTTITLVGVVWVLFANRTRPGGQEKTGHVYDGIEEYDNPLPAWWFMMFVITIVFAIGYLIAYPGMGNFKGLLGWTEIKQYQHEVAEAKAKYGPIFARFGAMPIKEVAADEQAIKMGRRIFANNCAQCHGSDARGGFGFPNLTDNDWLYGGKPQTIEQTITNGRNGAMPAWGPVLGTKGVDEAVAYVRQLSGHKSDPTAAAAGDKIFHTYCVACHGPDGKGNHAIGAPNLTDNIWLYGGTPALLRQTISNGRNGHMPAHKELLGKDKIHLLAAYVYALSHPLHGNEQGHDGEHHGASD